MDLELLERRINAILASERNARGLTIAELKKQLALLFGYGGSVATHPINRILRASPDTYTYSELDHHWAHTAHEERRRRNNEESEMI